MKRQQKLGAVRVGCPPHVAVDGAGGLLPEPDGAVGRVRWWYASTILDWHKNRPGKGWRKGLGA